MVLMRTQDRSYIAGEIYDKSWRGELFGSYCGDAGGFADAFLSLTGCAGAASFCLLFKSRIESVSSLSHENYPFTVYPSGSDNGRAKNIPCIFLCKTA